MNMTNSHHPSSELIVGFVDGNLTEAENRFVQSHLKTCRRCQSEIDFQRALAGAARTMPVETTSPHFVARTLERIASRKRESRVYSLFRTIGLVLPMIMALAGAIYVYSIVSPGDQGDTISRTSVESSTLLDQYRGFVDVMRKGIDAFDNGVVRSAVQKVPVSVVLALAALGFLLAIDRLVLVRFSRMKS